MSILARVAETEIKPSVNPPPARDVLDVILASAWEAFASAILLWALGGVAFSVAGSFAEGMIPSAPPGFAASSHAAGSPGIHVHPSWHPAQRSLLVVFFAIFFAHSLWAAFHDGKTIAKRRSLRMLAHLRQNWFSLIVSNAISAWVAALLLGIIPNFSFTQMFWNWVWEQILPTVQHFARWAFGSSNTSTVGDWISWYHANNSKLYFWIIYLGGMIDDLGVPNFKTLARWAWRRWQKSQAATPAASIKMGDTA